MQLLLPAGEESMPAGESTVLTLIPVTKDKVFYYHGDPAVAIRNKLFGVVNQRIVYLQKHSGASR